jgi:uncharacterized protein (TIGR02217 family)
MAGRVSQDAIETLASGTPAARVTQVVVEAPVDDAGPVRISQDVIEAAVAGGLARVSQDVIEAAVAGGLARASQVMVEVLIYNWKIEMPIVYPKLPGLDFPEGWETEWFNAPTQVASSGAEIDLGISLYPVHNFTLSYQFLNDRFGVNEQRLLRGFFGACRGNLGRFLYWLKEDHQVKAQQLGTTDGSTRSYTLVRTYGVGEASFTEPVGYVDQTLPLNVYLDGVMVDPDLYAVDITVPAGQAIIFTSAPTTGQKVTADFDFFYYCKFADPKMSLDKFMDRLWSGGSIKLKSCKAGA